MPFDPTTAIPVVERPDGLLEKDNFNPATAVPVDQSIPQLRHDKNPKYRPPMTDQDRARALVELSYRQEGKELPLNLKVDWALTSEKARAVTAASVNTLLTGGLYPVVQGLRGIADNKEDYTLMEAATKGVLYPGEAKRLTDPLMNENAPAWAKITQSLSEDVLSYGVAGVAKSALKSKLIVRDLARKLDKAATEFATEKVGEVPKGKGLLDAQTANLAKKIDQVKAGYVDNVLLKMSAVETQTLKTGFQEFAESRSIIKMLADEMNAAGVSAGMSIKPVVGQTVSFASKQGKTLVGKITEIMGNRATIDLEGRQVVAVLSQLRMPDMLPFESKEGVIQPSTTQEVWQGFVKQSKEMKAANSQAIPPTAPNLGDIPPIKPPINPPGVTVGPGDNYERNRQYFKTVAKPNTLGKDTKDFIDKTFVPISTRLSKIDESLRDAVRQHAFKVNMTTKADMDKSLPFMRSMTKMERDDMIDLDYALKNSDIPVIERITNKYGVQNEYKEVQNTLEGIYKRAKDAGMDVGHIENYFPRRITDVEAYLKFLRGKEDWGAISKALAKERSELGRDLKEEEKAEIINTMIRGYGQQKIPIGSPSNIKERKIIALTPEMNAFYKDSGVALSDYIRTMNDNIESRVFFGKEKNLENSIGNYVSRLVEDKVISPVDEESVRQILKSYFDKRGTHGIVTGFKNFSYIATMGSPISAITQIGDLAFSLYRNGFFGTVKAAFKKDKITKQDIGIDLIIEEFTDQSKSSKAVSKVFKAIGLDAMDAFGKEVLINGAMDRISAKAAKSDPELLKTLQRVFGNKADEVMLDLANKVPTDDVKYMLFSELADFQPIALTEMPEYYVKGGNLRLFYMLKSYTIKQLDVYHNEIFREKDPLKKMKKAVALAAALALMGATSDIIKDRLLGRKTSLNDLVIDNILRLVGFSKWQLYKTRQDGLFQTMLESILPPVPFLDDIYKDAMRMTNKKRKDRPEIDELRIWQRIPIIGKFYYWWFGGGEEIKEKEKKKRRISD